MVRSLTPEIMDGGGASADVMRKFHADLRLIHRFMGNGIVVNGSYITPYVTAPLEAILHQEGLTPVVVDTSEFEKAGGSCFCMKLFLS